MLERTSRFVLEVLPYLLLALVAAVVLPGFLYSQAHGAKASVRPNVSEENTLVFIGRDQVGPGRCCRTGPPWPATSWQIAKGRSSICGYKMKNRIGFFTPPGGSSFEEK